MAHQVFVSYATEDADTASRVCTLLEADGIQCWVAPRDVKAGTDYAAAIMDAIRNSQLVILIFSTHSNASLYALREVERSVAYGRTVLAIRADHAAPNSSMEYYLHDWIEAPEGVESKRKEIIATVRQHLARPSTAAKSAGGGAPIPSVRLQSGALRAAAGARAWYRRPWSIAVAAALVVAAVGLGLGLGLTRDHAASQAGTVDDHITWTELKPAGAPPSARDAHSIAHDPTSGRLVMFGGRLANATGQDTWAYDPVAATWTELKPSGTLPSERSGHSMAYDPVSHHLIMFGGIGSTGTRLNDTWAYDFAANTWTELKPSGTLPPPRVAQTMAYDPITGRLIVFGGLGGTGASLNDTWAYDSAANAWTELKPSGTLPSARSAHSMAYDPMSHRLIMAAGRGDVVTSLVDTWAYDPSASTWTALKPAGTQPSAREGHSVAYDPTGGRLIMFGGQDFAGTSLDEAWAYDPAANTWTELEPSGTLPRARAGHAMVYDPASGRLIMFGGHSVGAWDFLNDTWTCAPS